MGTLDMILTAQQLEEKCPEQSENLFMALTDLYGTFDSLSEGFFYEVCY